MREDHQTALRDGGSAQCAWCGGVQVMGKYPRSVCAQLLLL